MRYWKELEGKTRLVRGLLCRMLGLQPWQEDRKAPVDLGQIEFNLLNLQTISQMTSKQESGVPAGERLYFLCRESVPMEPTGDQG